MKLLGRKEFVLQSCLAALGMRGAAASLAFTGSLDGLTAGAPFDVTWTGAVGTSSLTLLSGTAVVNKIAFGISEQSLLWSPYAFTPAGSYTLQLDDASGQTATSKFNMLAAGTNPSSTVLHFTNTEFDITAGSPFNVTWTGAKGTTTLSLQQGDANSIKTADVIISDMTKDYVEWTPYATTTPGRYILRLDDSANDFAYGLVFSMAGSGSASTSSVSPSTPIQTPTPIIQNPTTSSNALSPTSADGDGSSSTGTVAATQTSAPTSSAGTGANSNPNSSPTSNPTSNPTNPSLQNSQNSSAPSTTNKSSLSTGAKAGIAIACSLAFIFLLTTLLLLYRQWNRKRMDVVELPGTSSAGSLGLGYRGVKGYFAPGENGHGNGSGGTSVEKGSDRVNRAEMRGEGRVEELDGYGGRGVV